MREYSCAAAQDYDAFYETEIELRRLRGYPPFTDMIRITASGTNEGEVLRICSKIRQGIDGYLNQMGNQWQLLGPAPESIARINNRYRYSLTLMGPVNKQIRQLVSAMLCAAHSDKENHGVSVFADWKPAD